jgi:AcrR family transcriptional regulator
LTGSGPENARLAREREPRPHSQTRDRVLQASRELLAESGVHGLTIDGAAARSGVAKTTIYRHWRSKEELALAVLLEMTEQVVEVPELGNTRAEFVALVTRVIEILDTTLMGRVMQGLVSDLATDPTLAHAFRENVVALRLKEIHHLIERGAERGDLLPNADAELLHDLLFGAVYHRLLLSGRPLDQIYAEQVVDSILGSITLAKQ